jgi:multidrug efflux system outer membrane protein
MSRKSLAFISVAALLGGCTMMPKYERPNAPVSGVWSHPNASTNATATAADSLDWRDFFDDPRLKRLIELALQNNRDLRVAALKVEQFRAQYRIQRADLFPGVQGNASYARQRFSGAAVNFLGGTTLSTYTLNVGAAYEVDLFGRVRSLKKDALERYLSTEEARKSAEIALVSEVATEYLTQLRLLKAKAIANQTLETVTQSYNLIKRSFEAGVASELDLRTAEGQVQTVKVNAAGFLQQLAQSQNALVVLVGQPLPADLPEGKPFADQRLLNLTPTEVPSEVLARRPDILAAEHTLQAANANIGAARAAFFPRILLTGSGGVASAKLSNLFTGAAETWSFSPQITIPIFQAGLTSGQLDVAKVQKKIEIANYEKAIQNAFREVADALDIRAILTEKIKAQEILLQAEQKRFELTTARYNQGVDNYVDVLLAQQDLYAAQQALLGSQAAQLVNSIELYRSLGGGWTEPKPESKPSS